MTLSAGVSEISGFWIVSQLSSVSGIPLWSWIRNRYNRSVSFCTVTSKFADVGCIGLYSTVPNAELPSEKRENDSSRKHYQTCLLVRGIVRRAKLTSAGSKNAVSLCDLFFYFRFLRKITLYINVLRFPMNKESFRHGKEWKYLFKVHRRVHVPFKRDTT